MSRTARRSTQVVLTYTVFGIGFGFCFPIVSLLIDAHLLRPSPVPVLRMIRENPIQGIVSLAPIVLGMVFFVLGRMRWEIERRLIDLRKAVELAKAADRAKSDFLASMSHEIRTPMNGVLGMTELLAETGLTPHQRDLTDTIETSGRSLLILINDILDLSKVEAGHVTLDIEPIPLATIVEEPARMLALAARGKDLDLVVRIDPALPDTILGDLARLKQIVINLANNAIKFTEAGQVVIDMARAPGNRLRVEIRDTGCGIPPDEVARLWEKFTQVESGHRRRHEGTGLGLAICKGFAELMGGRCGAESVPGQGSTFWFEVPLAEPKAGAEGKPALDLGRRAVLVVEPNEAARDVLVERLAAWNATAHGAADAAAAAGMIEAAVGDGRPYALMLVDRDIADRLPDLAAGKVPHLPTSIAMTAIGDSIRSVAGPSEPRITLVRPVGIERLRDAVTVATSMAPAASAPRGVPASVPLEAPSPRPAAVADAGAPPRVLVVDDNATNRKVLTSALARIPVGFEIAVNGADAIEVFCRSRPELVLMDVSMPVMDGLEASRRIREIEAGDGSAPCVIIGITAHARASDRTDCLAAGMDDHIAKPISLADLKRRVTAGLERRTRAA